MRGYALSGEDGAPSPGRLAPTRPLPTGERVSVDAETALLALGHAYLDFARTHRRSWAALFDPVTVEAPPALSAEIAASFALVETILDRAGGDPATVPVMAKALWSSVHGMVYLGETGSLGPVGREDVPAMIDTLVRAAIRGLMGTRKGG